MAFVLPPVESKKQINRAGLKLIDPSASTDDLNAAIELADKWRACHAYPINTFQATLRGKIKNFSGSPLVAQRLKRMPTIINKLKIYPAMKLTTMQDIGGVRAVLDSIAEVRKLAGEYRDKSRFEHELVNEKDYITTPRDEDGYRSLHLIYKYKNIRATKYNGLLVELQIRTKPQHIWATAVETMGTFLGQALKSRQGDRQWIDFFAVASSAFAYIEKTNRVPRFQHLTKKETFQKVADMEKGIKALEKMRGFSVAVQKIVAQRSSSKSWSYHLVILDSLNKMVQIQPYDRGALKQAMADYASAEQRVIRGEKNEPVLVSVGPIDKLRRAYPNFFLDIGDFINRIERIITAAQES